MFLPGMRAKSAQSCLTLCDPVNCSSPEFSVHRISQASILEWIPFSSLGDLPDPGIELRSPILQADSLLSKPPGKMCSPYLLPNAYVEALLFSVMVFR